MKKHFTQRRKGRKGVALAAGQIPFPVCCTRIPGNFERLRCKFNAFAPLRDHHLFFVDRLPATI